jgi:GNAT superfamily N-acetyltransferase
MSIDSLSPVGNHAAEGLLAMSLYGAFLIRRTSCQLLAQSKSHEPAPTGVDVEDVHYTPDPAPDRYIIHQTVQTAGRSTPESAPEPAVIQVIWMPTKPGIGLQGDTAVLDSYRNRGLGRWLKAAMIEKVLDERPDVKFIRTSNAESNAPMLKINQELGFQPYQSSSICQLETSHVLNYLSAKGIQIEQEIRSIPVS